MPKLIDYPRTSYAGAWELAEVVDDTGGKCAIETAAKKLNRKVSGSFKAIIGSAVKFGLMTSKRELLSTTTLFKRIKHAYDKKEELLFHREAFLTPPLFTQLCRKFRSRELPVQMLDVMLIREFGVEEINAQGVAKAFVEGCRMVGLLDEHNMVADIDALAAQQPPRRTLANPAPTQNSFRPSDPNEDEPQPDNKNSNRANEETASLTLPFQQTNPSEPSVTFRASEPASSQQDAIASLFGLLPAIPENGPVTSVAPNYSSQTSAAVDEEAISHTETSKASVFTKMPAANTTEYQLQISGPGVNSLLSIVEEEDVTIAIALLEKIRRQLRNK
ncbi:hypothetical protein MUN81_12195 [Hymenobacter sp. 5317J-9]|uniref:hypothetical protein n=1 Tax=Hymenobacter sp. 5317J-9 TaxID=2932250 RepID=UPI001FD6333C|nr:hypothetical protein [Hymenobacter sp. 5317J-9]UOQ96022.1 hypothetical protein MUN81_12195 [Hymenobacter sp. 5317J-9]